MKGGKIAVVVACLLLAIGIVYFTWGESEAAPQATEVKTNWKCEECGKLFQMTDGEFYDQLQKSPNGNSPLLCPECGKRTAWMVALCPKCNEWYYGVGKPGESGVCPRCDPTPKEETQGDDGPSERRRPIIRNY